MSTDNEMDDLLRGAGSRWRAVNPGSTTTVDFAPPQPQPPRRNRWLVAAAAAVVVAGVAVGGTWLGTHRTHDNTQASGKGGKLGEPTTWGGLTGTQWAIFEVTKETSNSSDSTGAEGSSASLLIHSDGSFTASDGCNTLSGVVTITQGSMTFGDVATTAIGCMDENVTKIASTIDAVLQGQVTWSVDNAGEANDLYIEHAGVGSLIYFGKPQQSPVTDPGKITGTWQLTEYDQQDTSGSGSGGSATGSGSSNGFGDILVIDADGTFKVQHRCYANAGKASFGDGTATWSDVHLAGSIPCPSTPDQKDEQDRNALVDSVLSGDTTWTIDNGELRITKGGNTLGYSPFASDSGASGSPTNGPTK